MYYVYVLWSEGLRKRYIGSTENLAVRLEQHNNGLGIYTKRGIPWTIIHTEEFWSRVEAERRERNLKSGQGRAWLDQTYPEFKRKSD
jgi:putative endonuclease